MTNFVSKGHLRLIDCNEGGTSTSKKNEELGVVGSQLSLELKQEVVFYFFREVDILRGIDFIGLLERHRPAYIFDVRTAPRLDFVAPSRSLAFKAFVNLNVNYIDVSGVFRNENDSDREVWAKFVDGKFLSSKIFKDAFFIFDNESTLIESQRILPEFINRNINSFKISVQLLRQDFELIAM